MNNRPAIRRTMIYVLAALFLGQYGSSIYDQIFSNFLNDAHHFSAEQRGFLELPRELPGILSLFAITALFFLNEVRISAVACLLMSLGMFALAYFEINTFWLLSIFIMIVSLGQHIMMGSVDSIVMHTARPENRSLRLGQMKALGTAAGLLGSLVIWIKWKFNQTFAVDYTITAILCLAAAFLLSKVKTPAFPKRMNWKQCLTFKKRYKLYYWIEILHGIRKQLYLTFGFWLMVNTLGQTPAHIGRTLLLAGILSLGFQPFIGWSIKKYGERRILIIDSIALSFLCLIYAFTPGLLPHHWTVTVITCCFVLDNLLFALGMARNTYLAKISETPEDITSGIYTGIAINHVASITYGVLGGIIWAATGGPQAVFLIGGLATAAAGFVASKMEKI